MAISQFPSSSGSSGGGSGLPELAVSTVLKGRATTTAFNYNKSLPAGKYRITTNGAVRCNFASNGQSFFVNGTRDVTLSTTESALQLTGQPKLLPQLSEQTVKMPSIPVDNSYYSGITFSLDTTTNGGVMLAMPFNSSASIQVWLRNKRSGGWMLPSSFSVSSAGQAAAIATGGRVIIGYQTTTNNTTVRTYADQEVHSATITYNGSGPVWGQGPDGIASNGSGTIVMGCQGSQTLLISQDNGTTWTVYANKLNYALGASQRDNYRNSLHYVGGYFIALTSTSGIYQYSSDGINWSIGATISGAGALTSVAANAGKFMFSGNGTGNTVWTTTNFSSYTSVSTAFVTTGHHVAHVVYADSKWYAFSQGSSEWTVSTDNGVTFVKGNNGGNTFGNALNIANNITGQSNTGVSGLTDYRPSKVIYDPYFKGLMVLHFYPPNGSQYVFNFFSNIETASNYQWAWASYYISGSSSLSQRSYDYDGGVWLMTFTPRSYGGNLIMCYDSVNDVVETMSGTNISAFRGGQTSDNWSMVKVGNYLFGCYYNGSNLWLHSRLWATRRSAAFISNYNTGITNSSPWHPIKTSDQVWFYPTGGSFTWQRMRQSDGSTIGGSSIQRQVSGSAVYMDTSSNRLVILASGEWYVADLNGSGSETWSTLPSGTPALSWFVNGSDIIGVGANTCLISENGGADFRTLPGFRFASASVPDGEVVSAFRNAGTYYLVTTTGRMYSLDDPAKDRWVYRGAVPQTFNWANALWPANNGNIRANQLAEDETYFVDPSTGRTARFATRESLGSDIVIYDMNQAVLA